MSKCQSLRLRNAALWDSMESGDISMDCLSQKCLSHCRGRKKKKKNKIGQQNFVGGRSDKAGFSRWVRLLWKEGRQTECRASKERKGAGKNLELSPTSHGGSSQKHISIWINMIWLSQPRVKYVMNHMRSANEAERQKGDDNKKFSLRNGETLLSFIEEMQKYFLWVTVLRKYQWKRWHYD